MKATDWVFLVFLIVAVYVLSGCAPDDSDNTSELNADCVIYAKSKHICRGRKCIPIPTAAPSPEQEPTPVSDIDYSGCSVTESEP